MQIGGYSGIAATLYQNNAPSSELETKIMIRLLLSMLHLLTQTLRYHLTHIFWVAHCLDIDFALRSACLGVRKVDTGAAGLHFGRPICLAGEILPAGARMLKILAYEIAGGRYDDTTFDPSP